MKYLIRYPPIGVWPNTLIYDVTHVDGPIHLLQIVEKNHKERQKRFRIMMI